ncbi:unnamed protein product [Penicillium nalgiovense]|uniref:Uncharacterized protein n=1 Tax=Penicillium nalgiovense TaxID=60175 RepID=A0A9W4I3F3_PENNA|nr:unnamed protein product [Penicillium nalgiovense]CAG8129346.1 unnamed protein product [Penicillium nalgiovense]CAG8187853.1 unnamed protein product [Penicillium nalgiovense]CAG8189393.1 unnamed protein product [Penicillium nalgiovense]CAG8196680.1 unnamed protein product [Penicillium nalgiovense]
MEPLTKLAELLVVSPLTAPVTRKRRVTPSSELSSLSESCILSPDALLAEKTVLRLDDSPLFAASKHIFPLGEAIINKRSRLNMTYAHLESPCIQIPPSRHIILPFNLREKRTFHRNSDHLMRLFPDTKAVLFDGYFLAFLLGSLPPKPWPLTIAGIQPYFTTDPDNDGPLPSMKRMNKLRLFVDAEIDVTHLPPSQVDDAFKLVFDFFAKTQISITEVQYWGNFFIIVLENDTDLTTVPRSIGCCNCFYLFENEVGFPQLAESPTRGITRPTHDIYIVDNSEYDILCPGVMLSSATDHKYLTAGVLAEESNSGERYVTVGSHGFLNGRVFHPCASGKEIGQVTMETTEADLALVKLHDNIQFANETFQSPLGRGPTQLQDFVSIDELQIGANVYMNSPFTGYSEGTCGPHGRMRVPSDDPSQHKWVKARWCYTGQGFAETLQDGVCGSAIWNDDGNVIGFFRYAPRSGQFRGWSLCVGADCLIEGGFKIANF